ncbi:MAG: EAL domain-containing protein, partial [Nitrospirae bacterium]|nr:EAL domain-containing protein [Nitrospirota bacterium]
MKVAVNLSARQFDQPDLIQTITRALDNARLDPKCLELEITESTIMKNPEDASTILGKLKSMGVEISIDDFGTGHSSLGYLRRLPVSYLKIDRSFVMNITTNPNDASIVTAIIALAHTLNLKVVAEGVETQEQLLFLREHGCDEMQGFLFSRPLPAEDISKLLSKKYL